MNNIKKVIVIGSGFGGIAAALRLKAKGHDVTIVEKQNDLGGRARVFKKEGYTFDAGPTVITAPHLIYELFELFNKKDKSIVLICEMGSVSPNSGELLQKEGFEDILILKGGINQWKMDNLPLV